MDQRHGHIFLCPQTYWKWKPKNYHADSGCYYRMEMNFIVHTEFDT